MKLRARTQYPSKRSRAAPTQTPVTASPAWTMDRRAVLAAGALALAGCTQRQPAPLTVFEGMVRASGAALIHINPERAAFLRLLPDGANLTRLSDRSGLAAEIGRSQALRGLTQILALERQGVRPQERAIFDVLLEHFARLEPALQLGMGPFSQVSGPGPYVLVPQTAAVMTLPATFAAIAPVQDLADAEDYLTLLSLCAKTIAAEADHARDQAQAGWVAPPVALERVSAACIQLVSQPPGSDPFVGPLRAQLQASGLLALAPTDLAASPPAPLSPAQTRAQALLARAETLLSRDIYPAILRTAQQCEAQRGLAKPPAPDFSRKWLAAGLRYCAGDTIDIEKTHAAARSHAKTLTDQLDMSLRALGAIDGSVGQRLAQLALDPRFDQSLTAPEAILAALAAHFASASAQSANWFAAGAFSMPDLAFADPQIELGGDGAVYQPAGSRTQDRAVLTLDLTRLRRKASYELATTAFSLGWPGRHALASLAKGTDLPIALRMISFPAFSEGWCRYGEQLADEYGLHEANPWQRIGYLQAQLRNCAALIADIALAWLMVPPAQAQSTLQESAGMGPLEASRAIAGMLARPGGACAAEIGRSRIVAARDRARIGLGPDFDLRTFHGLLLTGGELPLNVMDARVNAWILSKQKSR